MKKSLVFIVLGIPILIAVVLNFFGQNKYEIPLLYETGVVSKECDISVESQYYVPEINLTGGNTISWEGNENIVFCEFSGQMSNIRQELNRVVLSNNSIETLRVYAIADAPLNKAEASDIIDLILEKDQVEQIANCFLLEKESEVFQQGISFGDIMVLIDSKGRVRGYYDGTDPEEYDRLAAEADILHLEMELNEK